MKKRIISAIIMLAAFIPILWLGDIYYQILCGLLGMVALWELLNLQKNIPIIMQIISYLGCLFLIIYDAGKYLFLGSNGPLIFILAFLIYAISVIINNNIEQYSYKDGLYLMGITMLIGLFFNSMIALRVMGLEVTIYCFLISIMTDTFALFGGKLFGKHKLSTISPNKTIEGSVIGSLFGTIVGVLYYHFAIGHENFLLLIAITLLLTILGQIGDLFFSSIKRNHGIKDFSNLIPGHGGILDRLDNILFVILGFLLYTIFI